MSKDTINNQILLLQEQIENLERSGFFTEKEMDSKTFLLREEIDILRSQLLTIETVLGVTEVELAQLVTDLRSCKKTAKTYGMSPKSYQDGAQKHTHYFSQMKLPALINTCNHFEMNLTPIQG